MAQGLRYATLTFGVAIAKNSTFVRKEKGEKYLCQFLFNDCLFIETPTFKYDKIHNEKFLCIV